MSDEPSVPPEPEPPLAPHPQPPSHQVRPPVPGWMWALCGFGLVSVGAVAGAIVAAIYWDRSQGIYPVAAYFGGGVLALIPSVAWCLGLLLVARFFSGNAARLISTTVIGLAIFIGSTALIFAGCRCDGSRGLYR